MYNISMEVLQDVLQKILSASTDAFIIAILIAAFSALALFYGKRRIVALIFSFYPAALILDSISYLDDSSVLIQASSLVIAVIFIAYLIQRLIYAEFPYSRFRKFTEAILLGISATAITLAFSYHVVDISSVYNFSAGLDKLFSSVNFFWWLLAPLSVIFIIRR